ncbi:uncharacterized protein LOC127262204 [Andrographis paniculata]|uniref:uncharacterized protein LOC127262204 n=1 Tax=Andrographis paniculata TaxID=175694 RepID=UPI0021E90BA9|nr:uncharacterized protein LOC127262204 [Andrographis paniculata]
METRHQSLLKNKYWILRHGKSIPNEMGLIVSSLENGIQEKYQLASDGINQARLAGELLFKELEEQKIGLENVRICYSPFARTTQTAKMVASVLNIAFESFQCQVVHNIRERFFGPSYELKSHDKYPEIWAMDEINPFTQPEGGESVADVATRFTRALGMMESTFENCAVLVVSHGDPLQILQASINAAKEHREASEADFISRIQAIKDPSVLSQHRTFALNTGELRRLV